MHGWRVRLEMEWDREGKRRGRGDVGREKSGKGLEVVERRVERTSG